MWRAFEVAKASFLSSISGGLTGCAGTLTTIAGRVAPFSGGESLAAQNGAGGVLTFTFSTAVHRVSIEGIGAGTARVDPFGGTPSASAGIPVLAGQTIEVEIQTSSVKVFAPVGITIHVWGVRR